MEKRQHRQRALRVRVVDAHRHGEIAPRHQVVVDPSDVRSRRHHLSRQIGQRFARADRRRLVAFGHQFGQFAVVLLQPNGQSGIELMHASSYRPRRDGRRAGASERKRDARHRPLPRPASAGGPSGDLSSLYHWYCRASARARLSCPLRRLDRADAPLAEQTLQQAGFARLQQLLGAQQQIVYQPWVATRLARQHRVGMA